MNVARLSEKRNLLGVMGLICLASSVGLWLFAENPENNPLLAVFTRVGIVLGALWLALPKSGTSWAWQKAGPVLIIAIALIAVAGRAMRYALPLAIGVAIALLILRPRPKRSSGTRDRNAR